MAWFIDDSGDGRILRAATAAAAIACAGATAFGAAVEHYAEQYVAFAGSAPEAAAQRPPSNAIDYATTGSIQGPGNSRFVVLGPCGDRTEPR